MQIPKWRRLIDTFMSYSPQATLAILQAQLEKWDEMCAKVRDTPAVMGHMAASGQTWEEMQNDIPVVLSLPSARALVQAQIHTLQAQCQPSPNEICPPSSSPTVPQEAKTATRLSSRKH